MFRYLLIHMCFNTILYFFIHCYLSLRLSSFSLSSPLSLSLMKNELVTWKCCKEKKYSLLDARLPTGQSKALSMWPVSSLNVQVCMSYLTRTWNEGSTTKELGYVFFIYSKWNIIRYPRSICFFVLAKCCCCYNLYMVLLVIYAHCHIHIVTHTLFYTQSCGFFMRIEASILVVLYHSRVMCYLCVYLCVILV